jgi:type II secretory pathway pseudopilin PulG
MKRPKAFSLLEMILFIAILGVFSVAVGHKGIAYYRLYASMQAEKDYRFALDVFKKYARIETKTLVVDVVQTTNSTTTLTPKNDAIFHNKRSKIAPITFKKRIEAKKILFHPGGTVEFVE